MAQFVAIAGVSVHAKGVGGESILTDSVCLEGMFRMEVLLQNAINDQKTRAGLVGP
ncbi:hypothetical protein [Celeribacter persicus]|uniref:hypothetical protein n=1 Tax=Celeribacter persicus TaxID=1651082 RepID=UPI0014735D94|nr:hypothetical protein [Celeribacter persicus]